MPGVSIPTSDGGTEDSSEDHWTEAACAFVEGARAGSIHKVLTGHAQIQVIKLFLEQEVDHFTSDEIQETGSRRVVCETS